MISLIPILLTFTIVYIDDVVIYSNLLKRHFKHLNIFFKVAKSARLKIFAHKMELFQISVRFLGHNIHKGIIYPLIKPSSLLINFRIKSQIKKQLQRFLGSLRNIRDFYKNLAKDSKPVYPRLKKTHVPWTEEHAQAVRLLKRQVKELQCLTLANP